LISGAPDRAKISCGKGNQQRVGKANAVVFAKNPRKFAKNSKQRSLFEG
jgi:hypothetical protein